MLRGRRRLRWVLLAAVVLATGVGIAGYVVTRPPGDISNPDVGFDESEPTVEPTPEAARGKGRPTFLWPVYGFTKDRRRTYDPPKPLRPPFRTVWKRRAPALLEFPPVIARGSVYQLADNGELAAISKRTGRVRWKRKLGALSASSPAVDGSTLFVTLLKNRRGSRLGRIVALRRRDGHIRWARPLASRSESSPLVDSGKVYFGSEGGTVYAMRTRNGRVLWKYQAGAAVKGGVALAHGKLFFGDYAGRVHAIRTVNGRRVWMRSPARRAVRSGRFYATPAVAYGRVYIGATDGREYSLSTANGDLAWAKQTGRYVYSSAAVKTVKGLGPTVYFGSYDGRLYAVNARSGRVRWTFNSGGKISGGPTIIGDIVYFADLGKERTYGLNTRTGRVVFRREQGGYDPVVSDGERIYLSGEGTLRGIEPISAAKARKKRAEARKKEARERKRKKARAKRAEERRKKRRRERRRRRR